MARSICHTVKSAASFSKNNKQQIKIISIMACGSSACSSLKIVLQIGLLLLSTGECATVAPLNVSITMITYNVRNNNDGEYWNTSRSQSIAQTITKHKPDIVLLQEIRHGPLGNMFEDMKKLLPDYACDGCQFNYDSMTYPHNNCGGCSEGYAIFTLRPMVEHSNRSLVFSGHVDKNRRSANRIVMEVPGFKGDKCTVNIFGVHLSDAQQEQISNINEVLQWVNDTESAGDLGVAHVIVGDFNAKYGKWNGVNQLMTTLLDVGYADVQPQLDALHPTNCTYRCAEDPPADQTNQRDRFVVPSALYTDGCCGCVMIGNTSGGSAETEDEAWLMPSDHRGLLCTLTLQTASITPLCEWDGGADDVDFNVTTAAPTAAGDDGVTLATTTVVPTTKTTAPFSSTPLSSSNSPTMSPSMVSTPPTTTSPSSPPSSTSSSSSPSLSSSPPSSSPSLPTLGPTATGQTPSNPTTMSAAPTSHQTTIEALASTLPSLENSTQVVVGSATATTPTPKNASTPSTIATYNTTGDVVAPTSFTPPTPTLVTTATTATTELNASSKPNTPIPVAGIAVAIIGIIVLVAAVIAIGRKQMLGGGNKPNYDSHENLIFNESSVYGDSTELYQADEQVFTMQESDA
eukprot:m.74431 g.74431  ORF g.74431 m.74431 type:complete len:630 (+) comp24659_c0_seq1:91-1980(+)